MDKERKALGYPVFITIAVGALWGIFEATVGYCLHAVSFGMGWLVWYPAACFFMAGVYRKTRRISSLLCVGLLCASIKMLNILLPTPLDRVINPAISIVFEALAFTAVVFAAKRLHGAMRSPLREALAVLVANTGWRLLYALYLLWIVPGWMRDVSVISSAAKFIPFFITQNLITSALVYVGYRLRALAFRPLYSAKRKVAALRASMAEQTAAILKAGVAAMMVCAGIALQLLLQ